MSHEHRYQHPGQLASGLVVQLQIRRLDRVMGYPVSEDAVVPDTVLFLPWTAHTVLRNQYWYSATK